jgi:carboxyl-terminal processing protease
VARPFSRLPAIFCKTLAIALLAALPSPKIAAAQDRPTLAGSRPEPALHGAWRSRGYGYVLQIRADGLKLFHVAGPFCYADPRPKRDPDGLFAFYRSVASGTVAFSGVPGQTRYVFDRLPDLPAACSDRTPWTAPRLAALVAATFADIYPSFAERGIDWRARTAEAERTLTAKSDNAALFEALRTMLKGIEDPHVELHAKVNGGDRELNAGQARTLVLAGAGNSAGSAAKDERWQKGYRQGVLDVVLEARVTRPNDRLIWGRVDDIGYLNLLTMERFTPGKNRRGDDTSALDAALDEAMAAFQGARRHPRHQQQ